jgi:hypothetical protein
VPITTASVPCVCSPFHTALQTPQDSRGTRRALGDQVGVREPELYGDLPQLGLFLAADCLIRRRDREAAIEERQLLLARGGRGELAGHQIVVRATKERVLALGDLHRDHRLALGEPTALAHDALHHARLLRADAHVGARHARPST